MGSSTTTTTTTTPTFSRRRRAFVLEYLLELVPVRAVDVRVQRDLREHDLAAQRSGGCALAAALAGRLAGPRLRWLWRWRLRWCWLWRWRWRLTLAADAGGWRLALAADADGRRWQLSPSKAAVKTLLPRTSSSAYSISSSSGVCLRSRVLGTTPTRHFTETTISGAPSAIAAQHSATNDGDLVR
jgi:hypothetical protein